MTGRDGDTKRGATAALCACLLLAGAPLALAAQVVQGRVRLATDNAAEVGVILVDTAGAVVAGALTDSTGRYVLRAPAEGSYRVRVRRIGFAPDSSAMLRLAGVEPATFDARLTPRALPLSSVVVSESRRCVAPHEADELTSGLWQEVQNALAAAIATTGSARIGFTLHRFERQLDANGSKVVQSKQWELRHVASEPYVSIAAESLAAHGFVRNEGQFTLYAVPDARTLSSAAFARTHCLRPTVDKGRPAVVGLEFAPVGAARDGEVRGTLWVDRASSELRTLEYRYTGGNSAAPAQGKLEYRRLPSGAWVVGSWVVRVPVVAQVMHSAPGRGERIGRTMPLRQLPVEETVAVWEVGGDVGEAFDPAEERAADAAARASVRGRVVDSTTSAGMRAALVQLVPKSGAGGRSYGATTGDDGMFDFEGVRRGEYVLTVTAPRLDTLNTRVRPIPMTVEPESKLGIEITIPPADFGIASLCASPPPPGTLVLHGTLQDGPDHPVAGGRVSAEWPAGALTKATRIAAAVERHVAFTDSEGRYALCGLPTDRPLVIRGSAGQRQATPVTLEATKDPIRLRTVILPAKP